MRSVLCPMTLTDALASHPPATARWYSLLPTPNVFDTASSCRWSFLADAVARPAILGGAIHETQTQRKPQIDHAPPQQLRVLVRSRSKSITLKHRFNLQRPKYQRSIFTETIQAQNITGQEGWFTPALVPLTFKLEETAQQMSDTL